MQLSDNFVHIWFFLVFFSCLYVLVAAIKLLDAVYRTEKDVDLRERLLVSRHYPKFPNLKSVIANYYRTKRFKLDIKKYLFRGELASSGVYEINVSTQPEYF